MVADCAVTAMKSARSLKSTGDTSGRQSGTPTGRGIPFTNVFVYVLCVWSIFVLAWLRLLALEMVELLEQATAERLELGLTLLVLLAFCNS